MIRFLLAFGILAGFSRWEFFVTMVREPYCELLARSLRFVFSLTPLNPLCYDATVSVGFGDPFTILLSCDGVVLLVLFVAGAIAMPIQRTLKPYVWGAGCLLVLVFANWIRLVLLALTAFYRPQAFEVMHIYVAQGVLILVVAALFIAWLSLVGPGRIRADVPAAARA